VEGSRRDRKDQFLPCGSQGQGEEEFLFGKTGSFQGYVALFLQVLVHGLSFRVQQQGVLAGGCGERAFNQAGDEDRPEG